VIVLPDVAGHLLLVVGGQDQMADNMSLLPD
jgi:hypothetical protein